MKFMSFVLGLGVILMLLGLGVFLVNGVDLPSPSSGKEEFKVSCSGNVEVNALGVGDPELQPAPSCSVEKCSWYSLSLSPAQLGFLGDKGTVKLLVDGEVQAVRGFDTSYGADELFSLTSSCIENPSEAKIQLFNEQGTLADEWTGGVR